MVFGHLTSTYVVSEALKDKVPAVGSLAPLLVGAYLPDLVDKPLYMMTGGPGRGVMHSVFVLGLVFYILIRGLPRLREFTVPLCVGAYLHLAQDYLDITTALWPLLGQWENLEPGIGLGESVYLYFFMFIQPVPLAVELASYPFFVYFLLNRFRGEEPMMTPETSPAES